MLLRLRRRNCEGGISAADVSAALADPDVHDAVSAAPVFYGKDTRPVDLPILRIQIGDAVIDVGRECESVDGCQDIPAGVAALASLLRALTIQELEREQCAEMISAP